MTVYKCDRCGDRGEKGEAGAFHLRAGVIDMAVYGPQDADCMKVGDYRSTTAGPEDHADLCMKCTHSFMRWWAEGRKR